MADNERWVEEKVNGGYRYRKLEEGDLERIRLQDDQPVEDIWYPIRLLT